jgi:uncharacterized membrane protein
MTDKSPLPGISQRLDMEHVSRSEFISAMVHLYRGELSEATAWRSRIDTTSHWAVVLSATALSFVFSERSSERHVLIPIITLFCTFLLLARPHDRDQFLPSPFRWLPSGDARMGGGFGS